MPKLNDIIYWERSVGPGNRRDLVPMYFRGRLSRDTNEGMRGDVKARPVRLGKGPYVAVYGADAFVNREGERLFGDRRRTRTTRFGNTLSGPKPINPRRKVRHFSTHVDKRGDVHYYVTYDVHGYPSHEIEADEFERYRRRKGWR